MPIISFILTYYNLPVQMLCECIDSILALSLSAEEREIIVIDDGSDVSPMNELMKYGDDIIYVRQKNGGVSVARNAGLHMAKGTYIQFVDGDDQLILTPYEQCLDIVRRQPQAEIILFDFTHQLHEKANPRGNISPKSGAELMKNHNIRGSVWSCLFRQSVRGKLEFTPGIEYGEDEEFVNYEIDESRSLAILNLYECNFNDEYKDTVREMFTEVRDKGIQNVAVDVRFNPGGSDAVVIEFFRYLDIDEYRICTCDWRLGPIMIDDNDGIVHNNRYKDLTFTGNLYVLTTSETFSAAMEMAQFVRDNDLGIIIGEAPGNDPNSYGDVAYFSLPNSHIFMQISTKNWVRADADAPAGLIEPDIECDITHYDDSREALYEAISEDR